MLGVERFVIARISCSVTSGRSSLGSRTTERRQRHRHDQQRRTVEDHRHPFGVLIAHRLGRQPGREGRNETVIRSSRFSRITWVFTYLRRRKMAWWASQMPPIVMKLVA